MDPHNHKHLYTLQATPNLSTKPNYPFSSLLPSITDKSKQNHAWHFCDTAPAFIYLLCLLLSSPSKLFLIGGLCWWGPGGCWSFLGAHLAVAVSGLCVRTRGHGGSARTGWMLKRRHVELVVLSLLFTIPGHYQCALQCFLLGRLWLVSCHKA